MGGSLATAATAAHAPHRAAVVPNVTSWARPGQLHRGDRRGGLLARVAGRRPRAADRKHLVQGNTLHRGPASPSAVIGSMSFQVQANRCPLLGKLGAGTLNLAYNYPPVPNPMIDPSVAPNTTVTQSGPVLGADRTPDRGS